MAQDQANVALTLRVNGENHELEVKPSQTLLDVLRDDLGLTGTKRGCEDGACGACTVMVNGAVARSCRWPLSRFHGQEVSTIESLGTDDGLDPLQEAFIQADAVQCGFCTPGMIMAAKALLARNPSASRNDIARALGGNLCRCTGYSAILDAISRIAGDANGTNNGSNRPDSSHVLRHDSPDKATGRAIYAADLTMPNMLYGAILRSKISHGELLGIDTTKAKALPGVAAVVTSKDVPGINRFGRAINDQPVLADDKVRQIGDALAAVAAASPEIAAQALALIKVNLRPLPAVLDPGQALSEDAPIIHEDTNLLTERLITWGDAEQGLGHADVVVEGTYTTPWGEHAYIEPEAVLAYLEEDGQLVVRTPTQHSFLHQRTVAETMNLPLEQVRVLPTVIGGGFGGKTDVSCQCVVSLLALKTKQPVKLVYSRAESFTSTVKKHPFQMRFRTGATKEGKLTALEVDLLADTGAYASAGPGLFVRAGLSASGPYHFPNASIHGRAAYTNNPLAGAMRGFGAPQVAFALESQMDLLAARLGLDPLEFRLMNRRDSDGPQVTAQESEQESSYVKTLEAVSPYYLEAQKSAQTSRETTGRWRRGVGIASMRYGIGTSGDIQQPGRVSLELETAGRVRLLTGAVDLGQGSDTALTLIVAKELALSPDLISVVSGDTAATPDSGSSTGSRLIFYAGNAAHTSATLLKESVMDTASGMLESPLEELRLSEGQIILNKASNGSAARSVSLAQVVQARKSAGLSLRFDGEFIPTSFDSKASVGNLSPYAVYVSATHLAEVEVDTETGSVRVLRVVAAHDVGRAIYPPGLKGQIEGAVAMGLGFALKEQFVPGETKDFKQYRIATARDCPEVVTLLVEAGDPSAALGAKGVAECALVAVAPAIINAIADATGVRVRDLPATPARLLDLINSPVSQS